MVGTGPVSTLADRARGVPGARGDCDDWVKTLGDWVANPRFPCGDPHAPFDDLCSSVSHPSKVGRRTEPPSAPEPAQCTASQSNSRSQLPGQLSPHPGATKPTHTRSHSSPHPTSPANPAQPARTLTVATTTTQPASQPCPPASLVHPSTLPPTPSIHSSSTSSLFYNHPSFCLNHATSSLTSIKSKSITGLSIPTPAVDLPRPTISTLRVRRTPFPPNLSRPTRPNLPLPGSCQRPPSRVPSPQQSCPPPLNPRTQSQPSHRGCGRHVTLQSRGGVFLRSMPRSAPSGRCLLPVTSLRVAYASEAAATWPSSDIDAPEQARNAPQWSPR